MNLWSNIYTYGLTPEETEWVRRTFVTDFGYHLYEAEDFSDLIAFPAIGLFVQPYAMDADEREMLLDFYQVAHAHDRSLIIVFMDVVEIPLALVGTSIYIYEWGREWIARIQDGLISCAGIREQERKDARLTMGDIEEE
ncbi:hypothetical protein HMPREF9162_0035 [Selenomonas sp. oral taxon 137 str. F0430]|jgi:hypothetical protein|uniref:hypothetical protein n=1 Tax=Selenomonas sp. oral taxon 137 TaxID=712531 RepID=UPI0001EB2E87|nr:hypothetical protein [Selenomonas sp. oral taxon 137]EFR40338.1 hypothetical protein HMPREF9162_0035 [Selenomonas sp. oral taxon 137 str. F0430]